MDLITQKKALRTKYRGIRDALSETQRRLSSEIACKNLWDRFFAPGNEQSYDRIFLFSSIGSEIDTFPLFERAANHGISILYPRVFDREMRFLAVSTMEDMEEGCFSILEPKDHPFALWVGPEETTCRDLMVVPGLLFDPSLNRLGYGGGYYDRFLSGFKGTVCGFGFSVQKTAEQLPAEETDIPLNYYCCEDGLYDRFGAI